MDSRRRAGFQDTARLVVIGWFGDPNPQSYRLPQETRYSIQDTGYSIQHAGYIYKHTGVEGYEDASIQGYIGCRRLDRSYPPQSGGPSKEEPD